VGSGRTIPHKVLSEHAVNKKRKSGFKDCYTNHLSTLTTMKCPQCDVVLVIADRQGIEIDYCPQCRGVWLDRGELDKIIERSNEFTDRKRSERDDDRQEVRRDEPPRRDERSYGKQDDDYNKRHKKKSMLDDLFDF